MKKLNLTATFSHTYTRQEDSKEIDVYHLSGDKASLDFYAEIKGEKLRRDDDNGQPLFFCSHANYIGDVVKLKYVEKTHVKFLIDDSELKKAIALASYVQKNGGNELAGAMLNKLMGGIGQPAPSPKTHEEVSDDASQELGDL